MTAAAYVQAVQELAQRRAYAAMLRFVEQHGPDVEDLLSAEDVRILRVCLKHADMVTSEARARVESA
jgi:hypothetical protein